MKRNSGSKNVPKEEKLGVEADSDNFEVDDFINRAESSLTSDDIESIQSSMTDIMNDEIFGIDALRGLQTVYLFFIALPSYRAKGPVTFLLAVHKLVVDIVGPKFIETLFGLNFKQSIMDIRKEAQLNKEDILPEAEWFDDLLIFFKSGVYKKILKILVMATSFSVLKDASLVKRGLSALGAKRDENKHNGQSILFFADLVSSTRDVVNFAINSVKIKGFDFSSSDPVSDVLLLHARLARDRTSANPEFPDNTPEKFMKRCSDFIAKATRLSAVDKAMARSLAPKIIEVEGWRQDFMISGKVKSIKQEPVLVAFEGHPGVGKTRLVQMTHRIAAKIIGKTFEEYKLVTINPADKFASNVTSDTDGTNLDDYGCQHVTREDNSAQDSTLFTEKSNQAMPVNKADSADKGVTFNRSCFVTISWNNVDEQIRQKFVEPSAFWRRIDFLIQVEVMEEYQKSYSTALDPFKVEVGKPCQIITICIIEAKPPNQPSREPYRIIAKTVCNDYTFAHTFEPMLRESYDRYKAFYMKLKGHTKFPMCSSCQFAHPPGIPTCRYGEDLKREVKANLDLMMPAIVETYPRDRFNPSIFFDTAEACVPCYGCDIFEKMHDEYDDFIYEFCFREPNLDETLRLSLEVFFDRVGENVPGSVFSGMNGKALDQLFDTCYVKNFSSRSSSFLSYYCENRLVPNEVHPYNQPQLNYLRAQIASRRLKFLEDGALVTDGVVVQEEALDLTPDEDPTPSGFPDIFNGTVTGMSVSQDDPWTVTTPLGSVTMIITPHNDTHRLRIVDGLQVNHETQTVIIPCFDPTIPQEDYTDYVVGLIAIAEEQYEMSFNEDNVEFLNYTVLGPVGCSQILQNILGWYLGMLTAYLSMMPAIEPEGCFQFPFVRNIIVKSADIYVDIKKRQAQRAYRHVKRKYVKPATRTIIKAVRYCAVAGVLAALAYKLGKYLYKKRINNNALFVKNVQEEANGDAVEALKIISNKRKNYRTYDQVMTALPSPVMHGYTWEQHQRKFLECIVTLTVLENFRCYGTIVAPGKILVTRHNFQAFISANKSIDCIIYYSGGTFNVSFHPEDIHPISSTDLVLIDVPCLKGIEGMSRYMPVDKPHFPPNRRLTVRAVRVKMEDEKYSCLDDVAVVSDKLSHQWWDRGTSVIVLPRGTRAPGNCGLPCFYYVKKTPIFLGIHVGYAPGKGSLVIPFHNSYLKEKFPDDPLLVSSISSEGFDANKLEDLNPGSCLNRFDERPWLVHGTFSTHLGKQKSTTIPTDFQKDICVALSVDSSTLKRAPKMNRGYYEGEYQDPYYNNLEHMTKHLTSIDTVRFKFALADYLNNISSSLTSEQKLILGAEFDDLDAINGISQCSFAKGLPMQTAAGFGFPGKKKQYFLGEGPFDLGPKLRKSYEQKMRMLKAGIIIKLIYKASLKDEKVSEAKYLACLTRMFFVGETDFNLIIRKVLLPFMIVMQMNVAQSFVALGINHESAEWARIHSLLIKYGFFFGGDFSKFDKRVVAWIVYNIILEVMKIFVIPYNKEFDLKFAKAFAASFATPILLVQGDFIYLGSNNFSGNSFTTILNCIVNVALLIYCFYAINQVRGAFFKSCMAVVLGDDHLVATNEKAFNHLLVKSELKKIGMPYTMPSKDAAPEEFSPLQDLDFLKRRFVPSGGRVYSPLAFKSIVDMLTIRTVKDETVDSEGHHQNLLIQSLREMYQYQREEFEIYVSKMSHIFDKYNISPAYRDWVVWDEIIYHNRPFSDAEKIFESLYPQVRKEMSNIKSESSNVFVPGDESHVNDSKVGEGQTVLKTTTFTDDREIVEVAKKAQGNPNPFDGLAEIGDFLERPQYMVTMSWDASIDQEWDIFSIISQNTPFLKKLDNYHGITADFVLRFVYNGVPQYSGLLIASAMPDPVYTTSAIPAIKDLQWSQGSLGFINPTMSSTVEITVPLVIPHRYLQISSRSYGSLRVWQAVPLRSSAGVNSPVDVNIYGYLKNVRVGIPTTGLVSESDSNNVVNIKSKEMTPMGSISLPASAISNAAGELSKIPAISKPMTALQVGAKMGAQAAQAVGLSVEGPPPSSNYCTIFTPAFSNTSGTVATKKMAFDPNQALDATMAGVGYDGDELSIEDMCNRRALVGGFQYTQANSRNHGLWSYATNPGHCLVKEESPGEYAIGFTPTALASAPFEYWRGTCVIDLQFVCSAFSRSRVRVNVGPHNQSGFTADSNTSYQAILDVEGPTVHRLEIPYLSRHGMARIVPHNAISNFDGTGYAAGSDTWYGAHVGVFVENVVPSSNGEVNTIEALIWMSWKDIQFMGTKDSYYPAHYSVLGLDTGTSTTNFNPFVVPEGDVPDYEKVQDLLVTRIAPSMEKNVNPKVYGGEVITNLRQVLQRYDYTHTFLPPSTESISLRWKWSRFLIHNFPPSRNSTAQYDDFNLTRNSYLSFLSTAFYGWAGNVRWRFEGPNGTWAPIFSASRVNTPVDFSSPTLVKRYEESMITSNEALYAVSLENLIPNTGGNLAYANTDQEGILDIELPFYNGTKFAWSVGYFSPQSYEDDDSNYMNFYLDMITRKIDSDITTTTGFVARSYVAAAPGFRFIWFKCAPVAYTTSNIINLAGV